MYLILSGLHFSRYSDGQSLQVMKKKTDVMQGKEKKLKGESSPTRDLASGSTQGS